MRAGGRGSSTDTVGGDDDSLSVIMELRADTIGVIIAEGGGGGSSTGTVGGDDDSLSLLELRADDVISLSSVKSATASKSSNESKASIISSREKSSFRVSYIQSSISVQSLKVGAAITLLSASTTTSSL